MCCHLAEKCTAVKIVSFNFPILMILMTPFDSKKLNEKCKIPRFILFNRSF